MAALKIGWIERERTEIVHGSKQKCRGKTAPVP